MAPTPDLDLASLFREHSRGLAGAVRGVLGSRADVEEVLQEAFLRAWRSLEGGTRPVEPVAWVFVLTLNLARDMGRRTSSSRSKKDLDDVKESLMETRQPSPLQSVEDGEAVAAARTAIHALPDPEREVLLMRTSGDIPFSAVAEVLGIPVGTAKSRMRSALRTLRESLAGFDPSTTSGDAR